ncbi:hypothetical protein TNIN_339881 [Trichonephila inaurata madagascariensis]|uniref:Uncharacterized protein n=1 Tax=Trichonephila inaurata madagascariensis TaxID=2747483 RepID=A0A8X7BU07_9ARAC|nr:hypothetical protein TNIN_339881 [Trichonephila inaurata madagascariensis]
MVCGCSRAGWEANALRNVHPNQLHTTPTNNTMRNERGGYKATGEVGEGNTTEPIIYAKRRPYLKVRGPGLKPQGDIVAAPIK